MEIEQSTSPTLLTVSTIDIDSKLLLMLAAHPPRQRQLHGAPSSTDIHRSLCLPRVPTSSSPLKSQLMWPNVAPTDGCEPHSWQSLDRPMRLQSCAGRRTAPRLLAVKVAPVFELGRRRMPDHSRAASVVHCSKPLCQWLALDRMIFSPHEPPRLP
jgi:hypothetical protein